MNSQPFSPLWSRSPDESAVDYQLFAAWLQLPVPRPSWPAAALALHCPPSRLRRAASRHRWKTRAAAFDNQRAEAAREALADLLRHESIDWRERALRFRHQAWLLHEQMCAAAAAGLEDFMSDARVPSLTEAAALFTASSVLGRRAVGMPLDVTAVPSAPPIDPPDYERILHRIYGQPQSPVA